MQKISKASRARLEVGPKVVHGAEAVVDADDPHIASTQYMEDANLDTLKPSESPSPLELCVISMEIIP